MVYESKQKRPFLHENEKMGRLQSHGICFQALDVSVTSRQTKDKRKHMIVVIIVIINLLLLLFVLVRVCLYMCVCMLINA